MKKVLVVDDDIVMFRLFQVQVKQAGCEGFFFLDGPTALQQIDSIKPDLAVLDYNLPGIKGSELFQALKENPATKDIPIVFITGTASNEDYAEVKGLGATEVLRKPFSPRRLQVLIKELLDIA